MATNEDIVSSLGTSIYIGGTGALGSESSWVEIVGVTNFGEFGAVYTTATHVPVKDGKTYKRKATSDSGQVSLTMARIPSDAGQDALSDAAIDNQYPYNFRIILNDDPGDATGEEPTIIKFKALVLSYTFNLGDATQIVNATATLDISGDLIVTAATS